MSSEAAAVPVNTRRSLANAQAELVKSLRTGSPPPSGFDAQKVSIAAHALLAKRARLVQKAWPELHDILGPNFAAYFAEYAAEHTSEDVEDSKDARRFCRWAAECRTVQEQTRIRLAVLATRTGPPFGYWLLCASKRMLITFRLPWLGVRTIRLPWPLEA